MADKTDMGFPKGQVAQTLRRILYPELTDHEVEAIIVCLMAHLLIENGLNGLLYRWLEQDAPKPIKDEHVSHVSKARDALYNNIVKIDFAKKYSLVEPFFAEWFPKEAETPWKINDLRNNLVHARAIKDAKFEGQPISDEKTIERVFISAQAVSMQFDKFEEMIDNPHALAERWSRRLTELGERLV